jgi:hypothetical protein
VPAWVAIALEGQLAVAVLAAGQADTLRAVHAAPSDLTSAAVGFGTVPLKFDMKLSYLT